MDISRRSALSGLSVVLGGAVLGVTSCRSAPAKAPAALPENALITLGVQAGPPPIANKIGISSALKVGDAVYQIDCGLGSLNAFVNAGLKFDNLKSIFITHLHTDHTVDYPSFLFSGGYTAPKNMAPVSVFGPGPAGGLPPSLASAATAKSVTSAAAARLGRQAAHQHFFYMEAQARAVLNIRSEALQKPPNAALSDR